MSIKHITFILIIIANLIIPWFHTRALAFPRLAREYRKTLVTFAIRYFIPVAIMVLLLNGIGRTLELPPTPMFYYMSIIVYTVVYNLAALYFLKQYVQIENKIFEDLLRTKIEQESHYE